MYMNSFFYDWRWCLVEARWQVIVFKYWDTLLFRCSIVFQVKYNPFKLFMAKTDKMTNNFTFLYLKKTFLACRFCTLEGRKG